MLQFCLCLLAHLPLLASSLLLILSQDGTVLTYDQSVISFSERNFGSPSQLWSFNSQGQLSVNSTGDYLNYESSSKATQMEPAAKTMWAVKDRRLKSGDMCLDETAKKVLACTGGAEPALILLQFYDDLLYTAVEELTDRVEELGENVTAQIDSTDAKLNKTIDDISGLKSSVEGWKTTLQNYNKTFFNESVQLFEDVAIAKAHMETDQKDLQEEMDELQTKMDNITEHISAIHANYTALEQALHQYEENTNATVYNKLASLQQQVDGKSNSGHITPDNIYEFAVLFLFALGVINVFDLGRRIFKHSLAERQIYGNE